MGVQQPGRVLIIKPGSLGDIVHALPAFADVRRWWKEARIAWVVDVRWKGLLECVAGVDELVEFPRERFRGVAGVARFVKWLRGLGVLRPELALDLQGLLRSALIGRAARAGCLVGGSDAREGAVLFFDRVARVDACAHAVERCRAVVGAAGVPVEERAEFPLGEGRRPAGFEVVEDFVLLAPFARGQDKSVGLDAVGAFCEEAQPLLVVLAGRGSAPENLPRNVVNLLNATELPELLWLARRAAWVVAVDSGPAHIAAAVNDHVLAIHTWSDPRRVGPFNANCYVWRGGEVWRQALNLTVLPGAPGKPPDAEAARGIARWVKRALGW